MVLPSSTLPADTVTNILTRHVCQKLMGRKGQAAGFKVVSPGAVKWYSWNIQNYNDATFPWHQNAVSRKLASRQTSI